MEITSIDATDPEDREFTITCTCGEVFTMKEKKAGKKDKHVKCNVCKRKRPARLLLMERGEDGS